MEKELKQYLETCKNTVNFIIETLNSELQNNIQGNEYYRKKVKNKLIHFIQEREYIIELIKEL